MADTVGEPKYVTHSEFSQFQDYSKAEFYDIKTILRDMQGNQRFPLAIALTIVGMAAAVVVWVTATQTGPLMTLIDKHVEREGHPVAMALHGRMEERMQVAEKEQDLLRSKMDSVRESRFTREEGVDILERLSVLEALNLPMDTTK